MPITTFKKPAENVESAIFEAEKFLMTRATSRERVRVCDSTLKVTHYILPDGSRGQFEAITRKETEIYLHIYHDSQEVNPALDLEIKELGYQLSSKIQ